CHIVFKGLPVNRYRLFAASEKNRTIFRIALAGFFEHQLAKYEEPTIHYFDWYLRRDSKLVCERSAREHHDHLNSDNWGSAGSLDVYPTGSVRVAQPPTIRGDESVRVKN